MSFVAQTSANYSSTALTSGKIQGEKQKFGACFFFSQLFKVNCLALPKCSEDHDCDHTATDTVNSRASRDLGDAPNIL